MTSYFSFRFVYLSGAVTLVALASGLTARSQTQSGATVQKPPTSAPDKPQTGQALAKGLCSACHGPDGNSPDPQFPKIAGQKASYLELQLRGFKYGGRKSDVMSPIAKRLYLYLMWVV